MTSTPPGWYDDPQNPGHQRYWDGSLWGVTDSEYAAMNQAPASPATVPTSNTSKIIVIGVVVVFVLVAVAASLFAVSNKSSKNSTPATQASSSCVHATSALRAAVAVNATNGSSRAEVLQGLTTADQNVSRASAEFTAAAASSSNQSLKGSFTKAASAATQLAPLIQQDLVAVQALPASASNQDVSSAQTNWSDLISANLAITSPIAPQWKALQAACPGIASATGITQMTANSLVTSG